MILKEIKYLLENEIFSYYRFIISGCPNYLLFILLTSKVKTGLINLPYTIEDIICIPCHE